MFTFILVHLDNWTLKGLVIKFNGNVDSGFDAVLKERSILRKSKYYNSLIDFTKLNRFQLVLNKNNFQQNVLTIRHLDFARLTLFPLKNLPRVLTKKYPPAFFLLSSCWYCLSDWFLKKWLTVHGACSHLAPNILGIKKILDWSR